MNVTVYGIVGHAGRVDLPLESLDLEQLEAGQEFQYQGRMYEIRSVNEVRDEIRINVVMTYTTGRN
jgi:hypothetical protein